MIDLSSSRNDCFSTCKRKYHLRYNEGLIQKKDSLPLSVGSSTHTGLSLLYIHQMNEDMIHLGDQLQVAQKGATKHFKGYELTEKERDKEILVRQMIATYHKHLMPYDKFEPVAGGVEAKFEIPVGKTALFRGRIDLIGKQGNKYVAVEHKTTGKNAGAFLEGFSLSDQGIGYQWALQYGYGKRNTLGALINVLWKQQLNPPRLLKSGKLSTAENQWTMPEWYIDAITGIGEDPNDEKYAAIIAHLYAKQNQLFQREMFVYDDEDIKRLKDKCLGIAREMKRTKIWYRNPGQHCKWCEYKTVCNSQDEVLIDEFFTRKEEDND